MTKRYQCKACINCCILEVGDYTDRPNECPYHSSYYTPWELLEKEAQDMNNNIDEMRHEQIQLIKDQEGLIGDDRRKANHKFIELQDRIDLAKAMFKKEE